MLELKKFLETVLYIILAISVLCFLGDDVNNSLSLGMFLLVKGIAFVTGILSLYILCALSEIKGN